MSLPKNIPNDLSILLQEVATDFPAILRENLVGIYLWGSLTSDAFDETCSDVDCIVVTRRDLDDREFSELDEWFKKAAKRNRWVKRLDMRFVIDKEFLDKTSRCCGFYQYTGKLVRTGSDGNPIIWINIGQSGITLWGKDSKLIAPSVSDECLNDALLKRRVTMNYASAPSRLSRRSLLAGLATTPALLVAARSSAETGGCEAPVKEVQSALKNASGTKLVILGTGGGPQPTMVGRTRYMTSHMMLSGDRAYVLDCGLGVTNQFARTGIPFTAVRSIFITHHHPDHNIEYGPFLLLGWVQGMPSSVRAFGPPPLKQMTEDLLRAYEATIDFWAEDFKVKPLAPPEVNEVSAPGIVMRDENVKISAAIVQHPPVRPALAYRFDFQDRSIVFSGDTAPTEAVAGLAKGADVLVHEAMYVPGLEAYIHDRIAKGTPIRFDDFMAHMKADHTPVEDVGRIAKEAGVKTLVLSHLVPATDGIQDETWRNLAAKEFKGKIVVARDLMVL